MPKIVDPHGFVSWERRDHGTSEITNIVVEANHRRQGIGRRLIKRFLNDMKSGGVRYVYVFSEARNTNAHAFYQACAFALWGKTTGFYKKDGAVILGRLV